MPEYFCFGESEEVEINAWFGPARTLTPTHFDPKHNLLVQIFETKFVRLFPPSQSEYLYAHEQDSVLSNTSQVDMEDPEVLRKYPQLGRASYTDIILHQDDSTHIHQDGGTWSRASRPPFQFHSGSNEK